MNEQEFQNLVEEGKTALGLTWDDLAVRIEEVTQGTIGWLGPAISPYDYFTPGKFYLLVDDRATASGSIDSVQIHLGNPSWFPETIAYIATYRDSGTPGVVTRVNPASVPPYITIPFRSSVGDLLSLPLSKTLDVELGDYIGIVSHHWGLSGNSPPSDHPSKDAGNMFTPPPAVDISLYSSSGPVVGMTIAVPPDQWRLYFYEVIDGVIQYGTEEVWESWLT